MFNGDLTKYDDLLGFDRNIIVIQWDITDQMGCTKIPLK